MNTADPLLPTSPLERLAAGASSHTLLQSRQWLHRRVDHLSFAPATEVMTWHFSVDLTLSEDLPCKKIEGGELHAFWAPIALLRKWPPMQQFDLRDEKGEPLSLLTGSKNRRIDACALQALVPPSLAGEDWWRAPLWGVTVEDEVQAQACFVRLAKQVRLRWPGFTPAEQEAWLTLYEAAGSLVSNSLLWVRLKGAVGDRRLIKAGYSIKVDEDLNPIRRYLALLGWAPSEHVLEVPNLGERDSYHLEITPPDGMEIHNMWLSFQDAGSAPQDSSLRPSRSLKETLRWMPSLGWYQLSRSFMAKWNNERAVLKDPAREQDPPPAPARPHVGGGPHHGHVYMKGSHNQYGSVVIHLAVPNYYLASSALLLGVTMASLLTVMSAFSLAGAITKDGVEATVTVLLFIPALLGGYLLFRPGEHPLARNSLVGLRALTFMAGALPAVAAVCLVGTGEHPEHVGPFWIALSLLGWLLVVLLVASWLLPYTRDGVPISDDRPARDPGVRTIPWSEDV